MPSISKTNPNPFLQPLNEQAQAKAKLLSEIASGKRQGNAAETAISTQLNADVVVSDQLSRNVTQGTTVLQTADGGLGQIGNTLTRMKTLAAQATNGALDPASRAALNTEYQALANEVNNIAGSTEFNGQQLLDGSYTNQQFLAGVDPAAPGAIETVNIGSADINTLTGGAGAGDILTQGNATAAMANIDTALNNLSTARSQVGAQMSSFEFRADVIAVSAENLAAANSAQIDTDIAKAETDFSNKDALTLASIASINKKNQLSKALVSLIED